MRTKNLLSFLAILMVGYLTCYSEKLQAQSVDITVNPSGSPNIVTGPGAYHATEAIYLNSEIGASSFTTAATAINRIEFSISTAGSTSFTNFNIYLKEVTATTLSTGVFNTTGYTLVYSGSYSPTVADWVGIDLNTSFTRTPGSNLQILTTRGDGVTPTAYATYNTSNGNVNNASATSSRRYNGTTVAVAGTTSLTASVYRPAIRLAHVNSSDASISDIDLPASSCFNSPQNLTITVKNVGSSSVIATGAATVTLNVTGANTYTTTATNTTAIAAGGGTGTITFSNINLNNVGVNNIEAFVSFAGDLNTDNDTLRTILETTNSATAYPVTEDVESSPTLFKFVKILSGPDQPWTIRSTKYKNVDMADSLGAHSGSGFFMFNAYNYPKGNNTVLYSSCLSIPASTPGSSANLNFYMSHDTLYQSFGDTYRDSLFLTISTDKGMTWNRVAGYARLDANFSTIGWKLETFDLSSYAGQTIQIGFEGVSSYGNVIGLDDITVSVITTAPVKLVNFAGERLSNKSNYLTWKTATEINNKGFELQRSADGREFSKVTFVASKAEGGNTTREISYNFTDNRPLATANYYRLKQMDLDGKVQYSNVVMIKGNKGTVVEIAGVYPNPVVNRMNLLIASPVLSKATVVITDLAGKVVMQSAIQLNAGDNNLPLDVKQIATGTYNVKVISANGSSNIKFVKQ